MPYSITTHKRLKTLSFKLVNAISLATIIAALLIPNTAEAKNPGNHKHKSCDIQTSRPDNSKWILKNKKLSEGVRYTANVYQHYSSNDVRKTFNYILKDSNSNKDAIANFTITYNKVGTLWNTRVEGCGQYSRNKKNTLLITVTEGDKLLNTTKLNGIQNSIKVGQVKKPNANSVRVMNSIDLSETK